MTPIDKIREGIISNDMEKVIEGFYKLTGEQIQQGDPEREEESETMPEQTVPAPVQQERLTDLDFSVQMAEKNEKGHYARPESIEAGKNKFIDDGVDSSDIETPKVVRSERRPPVKMVEVTCHKCGKKEEMNANYKTGEFHRCDKCVGG